MPSQNKILAAKAITYRVLSMLITFSVVYFFTRSLPLTTGATAVIEILKTLWYFLYDSIWDRLGFVTVKAKAIGGIKKGYPLIPLPEKIKGFIALARPLTAAGGFIAGFFVVLLASSYYLVPFSLTLALLVAICLALLHIAAQALNQSITEEVAIDMINKPYRPVVTGVITQKEALGFAIILYFVSAVFAFVIKPVFVIGVAIIAFFSIFYTIPPLRIKPRYIINNVWQGIARGALPVLAIFSIFSTQFDPFPLALATVICLWVIGAQSSKDIDDIEGDREFGIRNFFTVLNREQAFSVMAVLMAFSFVFMNAFIYLHFLPVCLVPLNLLVLPSFGIIHFLNRQMQITENNGGWILFYATMSLWYVFPAILLWCQF